MKLLIGLGLILIAIPAQGALPYGDGFGSGNPDDYVEGEFARDRIRIVSRGGVNTLIVSDTEIRFRPVVVKPNTKYSLSFNGSFNGDVESLEENPRFAAFAQPWQGNDVLPSRRIQFLDGEGKPIGRTLVFSIPFSGGHNYTDVFYTSSDAASLRLEIESGDGVVLSVQNLALEPTADEGALNINPVFQLGPFNYSGWSNISAGGKIIEIDDRIVLDTKYGSRGASFPLPGPGTYALSAKATGNGYNSCVKLDLFDVDGEKQMTAVLRRYDQASYFVRPPEAVSASLLVYSCLLEEVRIVRVGDETAIDKLLER